MLLLGPVRAVQQISDFYGVGRTWTSAEPAGLGGSSGVSAGTHLCCSAGTTLVDPSQLINHCRALGLVRVTYAFRDSLFMCFGVFFSFVHGISALPFLWVMEN